MSIATRRGDAGETGLMGGRRVSKTHPRIAWVGALDEAGAALGWARAVAGEATLPPGTAAAAVAPLWGPLLRHWQELLVTAGGIAATPADVKLRHPLVVPAVADLDAWVLRLEAELPTFRAFVMSGDTPLGAALDVARASIRRAERFGWLADQPDDPVDRALLAWLNRLADVLWLLARLADRKD